MPNIPEPRYIRPAQAPLYGITRSTAYNYMNDGLVKSTVIRRPENERGVRLISVASLKKLIEKSPAK